MTDDSIIRVYRFLNSNYDSAKKWQADADENYGNNNGVLTKNEFCNFMLDLEDLWVDGLGDTDNAKRDVINKFWATIDSTTSGNIKGKSCSNKNAASKSPATPTQIFPKSNAIPAASINGIAKRKFFFFSFFSS